MDAARPSLNNDTPSQGKAGDSEWCKFLIRRPPPCRGPSSDRAKRGGSREVEEEEEEVGLVLGLMF